MTAGYHESGADESDAPTRSTGRPGPLPPRTEHPMGPSHSTGPIWPASGAPAPGTQPGGYPANAPATAAWRPPAGAQPAGPQPVGPRPTGPQPTGQYPAVQPAGQYPTGQYPAQPTSQYPAQGAAGQAPVSAGPLAPSSGPGPLSAPPAVTPPAPGRRSPVLTVLVIVLLVLAVVQGVALLALGGKLNQVDKAQRTSQAADAKKIDDLEQRSSALEKQAAASLDSQAVATAVLPSVFKVEAGDFSGTAFVIQSDSDSSTLLTNYHVVAEVYEGGGRSVDLVHDNERYTAKIIKADEDDDLALLQTSDKFPALAVAKAEVATGEPVVVVGAPLGLAQSVTTGVVSAIRDDVPGGDGKTYIQFSAPINPGNSGGPVVDAQKQVVGIASAVVNNSEAIGLAIPISVACKSLDVC